ncbi:MAG: hypothetical protein PHE50_06400 [Dehalococcoidales bacterium]|nr:hypothetical protein [Dehalococcoidales bacterium]
MDFIKNAAIYLTLLLVFIFLILLFTCFSEKKRYTTWIKTNHVPRWVKQEVKSIRHNNPNPNIDSCPNGVSYLQGKYYVYRISHIRNNEASMAIERKPKKYNRKTHTWEEWPAHQKEGEVSK